MIKKIIRIASLSLLVVLVIGTIIYLYKQSKTIPEKVESAALERRSIVNKTVATGTIVPDNEITIRPRVSGIVEQVFVKPGDIVKVGDAIARIRVVPNMAQLNAAETQVEQSSIAVRDTKRTLDRQKQLFDKGAISLAELQAAEVAYDRAEKDNASARNNLSIVREGASKRAGAATNTIVAAPIAGMVLSVPVEKGYSVIESNTFNEGTAVAEVADMRKMVFEGTVDETEVGKIRIGMPIRLTIGALNDIGFDAVLRYIAPQGKKENGAVLFDIEADVKLQEGTFVRAGYSASADIVLASVDSVWSVEEKNLIFDKGQTFVEIQKDSLTYEKTEVKLGLSDGIYAELKTDLPTGTKVKVQKK